MGASWIGLEGCDSGWSALSRKGVGKQTDSWHRGVRLLYTARPPPSMEGVKQASEDAGRRGFSCFPPGNQKPPNLALHPGPQARRRLISAASKQTLE